MHAANNYSHKSHAIKFKKTAKTNEFLHRIHALKNKPKISFVSPIEMKIRVFACAMDKLSKLDRRGLIKKH